MDSRKPLRLEHYDYSTNGCYFITICTKDKKPLLSTVGASLARPQEPVLSKYGIAVDYAIQRIPVVYPSVRVDKYVIMPNHVHLLISIDPEDGRARLAPTISRIVQQTKGLASKQIGQPIWQKSFYDEITRNDAHYLRIWNYIDTNPFRWTNDEYYLPD